MSDKDQLIGDDRTFNSAFRYYRASGECQCERCGMLYIDHPVIRFRERVFYGCELHVLCNADRVKL